MSTVVFLCGPAGSGKSTFAKLLEDRGLVRLSFDVLLFDRGITEAAPSQSVRDEVELELRARLVELLAGGHDVVLDFSVWSRQMRDEYRTLLAPTGATLETYQLPADRDALLRRLHSDQSDPITAAALDDTPVTVTDRPRVLVVVNDLESPLRRFRTWLDAQGVEIDERVAAEGLPTSLTGYAGLLLLGGGFMPDDDERAPWLPAERKLAEQAIELDLPTLGICLGGQLLAQVAGGEVQAGSGQPEYGHVRIDVLDRSDPLMAPLAPYANIVEHHQDRITKLPPRAHWLARSRACPHQAFRLGAHVYGVQFHPETGVEHVRRWDRAELAANGQDYDELLRRAVDAELDNSWQCSEMARAFALLVQVYAAR